MRTIILLLVFVIAFYSCKFGDFYKTEPKTPTIVLKNCPNLSNFIRANWRVNKAGNLYKYELRFVPKLKSDFITCIQTLNKQDIIDLFGIPSEDVNDGYLNYYISDLCNSNSIGVCKFLSFIYDTKTGKIITMMEMSRQTME
jgi:hypothetical protein